MDNNQITQITGAGPFSVGANSGAKLELQANKLTTLDATKLAGVGGSKIYLIQINLAENQITQITDGPITFSSSNPRLDLSWNAFTSFDGGWISVTSGSGKSDMGNITLSYNQITTITNPPLTTPKAGNGTSTLIISRVRTQKINKLNSSQVVWW